MWPHAPPRGTQDLGTLYRAFRGRDPSVEPLLEELGLEDIATHP
jgi:Zn-dependent oligopeptidase